MKKIWNTKIFFLIEQMEKDFVFGTLGLNELNNAK